MRGTIAEKTILNAASVGRSSQSRVHGIGRAEIVARYK
jgi:hypothetical protein